MAGSLNESNASTVHGLVSLLAEGSVRGWGLLRAHLGQPVLTILVGLVAASCADAYKGNESIELTQTCEVILPGSPAISGGAIADNGDMLLWSESLARAWIAKSGSRAASELLLPPGTRIVGGAFLSSMVVELIDGPRRNILRATPGKTAVVTATFDHAIAIHTAARVRNTWLIGGKAIDGKPIIVIVEGRAFRHLVIPPNDGSSRDTLKGDGFFLRAFGDKEALASWVDMPFRTAVVGVNGSIRWLPGLLRPELSKLNPAETGWNLWHALAAFSVYNGSIVQTLADAGSDRRELLVRDPTGRVIRQTSLSGPMGMVSSSPSGRTVLAFTRLLSARGICYEVALS